MENNNPEISGDIKKNHFASISSHCKSLVVPSVVKAELLFALYADIWVNNTHLTTTPTSNLSSSSKAFHNFYMLRIKIIIILFSMKNY